MLEAPLNSIITASIFAVERKISAEKPLKSKIRTIPAIKSMQLITKKKNDFNEIIPLKIPFIISKTASGIARKTIFL